MTIKSRFRDEGEYNKWLLIAEEVYGMLEGMNEMPNDKKAKIIADMLVRKYEIGLKLEVSNDGKKD